MLNYNNKDKIIITEKKNNNIKKDEKIYINHIQKKNNNSPAISYMNLYKNIYKKMLNSKKNIKILNNNSKKKNINRKNNLKKNKPISSLKSIKYNPISSSASSRNKNNSNVTNSKKMVNQNIDLELNIVDLMKKEEGKIFYNKNQNCHHTIIPLFNLLEKQKYDIVPVKFNDQTIMWKNIWDSLIDDGNHYLVTVRSPGHFWYLEILNKKFRILSLYDGEHNFIEYSKKYKYGTFHNKIEVEKFINLLNDLNGKSIFDNLSKKDSWSNIDELEKSQKANDVLFGIMKNALPKGVSKAAINMPGQGAGTKKKGVMAKM